MGWTWAVLGHTDSYLGFTSVQGLLLSVFAIALVLGHVLLLRQRARLRRSEQQLAKRLRYERALTAVSLCLRDAPHVAAGLDEALRVLLDASEMDRVYVFKNVQDPVHGLCANQTHECVRAGIRPQLDNPDLQALPYSLISPSGEALERMSRRIPYRGPVSRLPEAERRLLESQEILDILILPIYAGDDFWGFVGFDDCTTIDRLDPDDVELLQNATDVIGWHLAAERSSSALRESQRSLATLLGNLPGMAYRCLNDHDWTMEFVSEGCHSLTGLAPADLTHGERTSFVQLIHPDDREAARSAVAAAIAQGRKFQLRYRLQTAAGETRWVWDQGQGVVDSGGGLVALEGFVLDITAQKAAEDTLAKYRLLSEYARDVILFVRPEDGRIVEANRAACEAYCLPRAELLNKTIFDLRAEEGPLVTTQMDLAERAGVLFEAVHRRRAGSTFPVEVSSRAAEVGGETLLLSVVRDITERKQAELALKKWNAELEQHVRERTAEALKLYNHAPCAYVSLGLDGLVQQINDTGLGWLGYQRDEVQGRLRISDLMVPESAALFQQRFQRFVQSETLGSYEMDMRRKDGATLSVLVIVEYVRDVDGGFLEARCTALDITERKRIERTLQEAQQRFERLFRKNPALMAITDVVEHRFLDVNDTFLRTLGYTKEEVLGQSAAELGLFVVPEQHAVAGRRLAGGGHIDDVELQVRRKDGTRVDGLFSGETIVSQGREYHLTVMIDITRLRQATEKLRKLSEAVEHSPSMIFITDHLGRVEYVNPAWERTTGYQLAEVRGQKPARLKSGIHPPEHYANLWREITAGRIWRGEFCNRKKNGELFWEAAAIAPVRDEAGVITHFVAVKEDATIRKQAEDQLRLAKEAAELANRAKSEFLANMSHEIRTPMTSILGYSELVLEQDLSEAERRDYLTVVHRNGTALLRLLDDILDLSKIEAGRLEIERLAVSPWGVVGEVLDLLRMRAEEKGLTLTAVARGPLPATIRSDPVRLRQILVNLVGNAIKFTKTGEVRLEAELVPGDPAQLQFAVQDTGIGIERGALQRIFEPFSQADTSHTRRFGGSGLGLAICKRLATLLGGRIAVDSQPGVGSTFTLVLALAPPDLDELVATPAAASGGEAGADGGALTPPPAIPAGSTQTGPAQNAETRERFHGRVLLAEDAPDSRGLIQLLLGRLGVEVDVVENGQDACRRTLDSAAAGRPYDLILMDVQMPQLNGLAATELLRKAGWQGRIVALTAHAMAGDRRRCLDAGCDNYLAKPVSHEDLARMLRCYLPAADAWPKPAEPAPAGLGLLEDPFVSPAERQQLQAMFQASVRKQMPRLKQAWQEGDGDLAAVAGILAGAAKAFGVPELEHAAREVAEDLRASVSARASRESAERLLAVCEKLLGGESPALAPRTRHDR